MKKIIITLIQILLAVALIGYLFYSMHANGKLGDFANAVKLAMVNWPFLAIGAGGFFFCILFCTIRWNMLLKTQGIHLPFLRVFVLYFVGHFFSMFLPGGTGGDIFKAYFVATESKHNRTEAVATVFIDRIIGLIALILLTAVIMAFRFDFFMQFKETRMAMIFIAVALAGTTAGIAVVFGKDFFMKLLGKDSGRASAVRQTVERVYVSFKTCITGIPVLSRTLVISVLNHLTLVVSAFFLGKALELELPLLACVTVFPIINAVAGVPLTPGALGTREAAAVFLLGGAYGISQSSAMALSLLLYASTLMWGLVGGLVYSYYIFTGKSVKDIKPA